jgi:glycosyltransferase involved in cell wall biosynthesis
MSQQSVAANFVVVEPARSCCDYYARVLDREGLLRFLAVGTRRGVAGVGLENTRLKPEVGLVAYLAARTLGSARAEAIRFGLCPWIDRWALKQLRAGNHVLSSYGYANECFKFARRNGGKTLMDAGNSHIEHYWELIAEEHRRWNCRLPPFPRNWFERSKAMLPLVDYVLSPSSYVTNSFLERGFSRERILQNVYPVDLSVFRPSTRARPKERPLTIINTGSLSLRKGTPYLLEAFRLIRKQEPNARLLLTQIVQDDVKRVLAGYGDLPIDWSPSLSAAKLAERLQSADVFVLPSLEEGLVRTACEAMACGLQVVLTPHCGANDFVRPTENGEIVPIRDATATAEATLKCWARIQVGAIPRMGDLHHRLSFETFASTFLSQLYANELIPRRLNS